MIKIHFSVLKIQPNDIHIQLIPWSVTRFYPLFAIFKPSFWLWEQEKNNIWKSLWVSRIRLALSPTTMFTTNVLHSKRENKP